MIFLNLQLQKWVIYPQFLKKTPKQPPPCKVAAKQKVILYFEVKITTIPEKCVSRRFTA